MSNKNGKAFDVSLLKRIYTLAIPYKWLFITTVSASLILAGLSPLRAWLTQISIDQYIGTKDLNGLFYIILWMFVILIAQSIIQFFQAYTAGYIGQHVIKHLRIDIFKHIHSYQVKKLDQSSIGTLVTRNISDLETIAEVFNEGLISIIGDLLQIIFIVILMLSTHIQLTLISLAVLPLLLLAGFIFKNAVKNSFISTRNEVTRLNTFVQEHIQGMQIVQIFSREKQEYTKFEQINAAHRDAQNKGVFAYAVFFPVVEIITAISTALIVWFGVSKIIELPPSITLGMLTSFLMLINMFFRPVRQLADRFNTLQMGMVAAERIFILLDEKDAKEVDGTLEKEILGTVEFKDVYFAYNENQPVLKGVSFKVDAGKTLAIVGATGAGKSSIINLVNRFYNIQSGEILIDGIDIYKFKLDCLRKNISVVQQEVFLFSGSIKDNLTLFDDTVSMEAIIQATKMVGIHDFISSLPNQYNEYVHERGATLSSGQRQLIAFARAILTNPRVLILDEATASVDTHAEEQIQKAIAVLMKNRTSIAIAHRLSTIQSADEILVLDKGQIIERGTHQQLIQAKGMYNKLYEMQLG